MAKNKEENKKKQEEKSARTPSYDAKDIYVLEGLEPVRKRPGMYIGSTGPEGLHHLIWEVVDNSIDEAMAGYAKNVKVELLKDNRIAVTDDGRGIPVDIHPQTKKSALETVMCTLHAGGKFGGESYKVSGGLHGVGVSVVNALSTWVRAEVCRDGYLHAQEYKYGKPTAAVKKIGKCDKRGTKIIFDADPEIFQKIEYDLKKVIDHLRQQAYLTKGVRVTIIDEREENPTYHGFYFDGGVKSFLHHLVGNGKLVHDTSFYVEREIDDMGVEVAFAYTDDNEGKEMSFANNIYTPDGGMHLTGFRSALTRSLNDYAKKEEYLKGDDSLTGDDVREGIVAVVSVKIREPQFEGQTKARLGNPSARTGVESVVGDALKEFLERYGSDARHIIEKNVLAAKARKAAKAAKDTVLRKGVLEGLQLPGKLADCSSKRAEESELFVVEGDSAGGCFSGDTKVALADGRNLSFYKLVEEYNAGVQNYCYTMDKNNNISIAPILHPRMTKAKTSVIKIALDNGEEIICTPDHKFMLRDGSYKEAQQLQPFDSLMPLYRKKSIKGKSITIEGYEMVFQPSSHYWKFTHLLADEYNLQEGIHSINNGAHRHHIDFNKTNNNPTNVTRLSSEEHLATHRKHVKKTLHRPDVIQKCKNIRASAEYREKIRNTMLQPLMRKMLSERAKKQWENKEYKKGMLEQYKKFYDSHPAYQNLTKERLTQAQKKYWSDPVNIALQSIRTKSFFKDHPEEKAKLSTTAKKQWKDKNLLLWRSDKTREQWNAKFRIKRKLAYNQTYLMKSMQALRSIFDEHGYINLDAYNSHRIKTKNKNLLRFDTLTDRFFNGEEQKIKDAVLQFNHKIKNITFREEGIDVYDLEVANTHNFALASGVFVHNSAKTGRDRRTQAILPLKGKILNVEKARLDKMLLNKEVRSLVIALGTAIADNFDIAKLRYHRIILMTDADVDGSHIRTLLLTLFYRHFPRVLEGGYLYIAQPPLYRIQKGKTIEYAYNDSEKEKIIATLLKTKLEAEKTKEKTKKVEKIESTNETNNEIEISGIEGENVKGVNIQRYKGLGEMNPSQLWETTMNPETRSLRQVQVNDAVEADKFFDILMGEVVEPRKNFIQAHATTVKNLDI